LSAACYEWLGACDVKQLVAQKYSHFFTIPYLIAVFFPTNHFDGVGVGRELDRAYVARQLACKRMSASRIRRRQRTRPLMQ
jgi:hypothetical protein